MVTEPDREAIVTTRMLKYRVTGALAQTSVLMREGAVIRAVGVQDSEVYAWAETATSGDISSVTRTFCVIGTGADVPELGAYLGSVFDGPFVWHVYEVTP